MKLPFLAALLLSGCATAYSPPPATPAPRLSAEEWQAELEAEQICLNPGSEQVRLLCAERRARQSMVAEQSERDQRAREVREHEEADRAEERRYERGQRAAAAMRAATAPYVNPLLAPSRTCVSMLNGNTVTTTCP